MRTPRRRLLALASAAFLVLALAAPTSAGSLGRVSWSPSSINFGKVQVGAAAFRTVWITNGLKVPALITAEAIDPNNSLVFEPFGGTTNDCFPKVVYGEPLNPGETCGQTIAFQPEAAGAYSAKFITTLSVTTLGGPSYTATVNLRGTGY